MRQALNDQPKRLSELCQGITPVSEEQDCLIHALSLDSRDILPGTLFFALPGTQCDGRQYIKQALENGAVAVLCEAQNWGQWPDFSTSAQVFKINDLKAMVGLIAERFYSWPTSSLKMVGVTGTNGKTSCTHFIAHALAQTGLQCAIVGTAGVGFLDNLANSALTTPDSITLHRLFADFVQENAQACAMEVSSHALDQQRTTGIQFDYAIFTNLTQDHLDYHGTMEKYGQAKRILFNMPLKAAIINADDPFGRRLIHDFKQDYPIIAYAQEEITDDLGVPLLQAKNYFAKERGFSAQIVSPWGNGVLESSLIGRFNLSNLLAVLGCLLQFEIPFYKAISLLAELRGVVGRMETFGGGELPTVVVDYAHTPDALEKSLTALKSHVNGRLWCLFGCGGDRDKTKRPLMGAIAESLSDYIVLTNDNPRHEDPSQILADIQKGLSKECSLLVEADRTHAIRQTIFKAKKGDVVLVAGKGHERTQQIGDHKYILIDQDIVQEALIEKRGH